MIMRHFKYTQEAFDEIAKIICEEKQAEIEALKEYIEKLGIEARKFSSQYYDPNSEYHDIPHELYDFLEGI
jgi:hypothetical protein